MGSSEAVVADSIIAVPHSDQQQLLISSRYAIPVEQSPSTSPGAPRAHMHAGGQRNTPITRVQRARTVDMRMRSIGPQDIHLPLHSCRWSLPRHAEHAYNLRQIAQATIVSCFGTIYA